MPVRDCETGIFLSRILSYFPAFLIKISDPNQIWKSGTQENESGKQEKRKVKWSKM